MSETTSPASAPAANEAPSAPEPIVNFTDNAPPSDAALGGEEPAPAAPAAEPPAPKTVPLAALHEERERRKELAEQNRRLETRFGDLQQMILRQNQPQQPRQPDPPAFEHDPANHLRERTDRLEQELARVRQPIEQQTQEQQFVGAYRQHAEQFARETPDFGDAYSHALSQMAADAAVIGIPATDMEKAIVARALAEGVNPASRIYAFAKARGYGAGRPAAPAATAADGVAAMQRGAEASRSAGAAPGPVEGNLTLSRMAAMPLADFAKMSDAEWKKTMGG